MDTIVEAVKRHLAAAIPGCNVRHEITENNKYKFTIDLNGPPHCHRLFVQRIFLDDKKTEQEMLQGLAQHNVTSLLQSSAEPRRLYLSNDGLKNVDEHFS